MAVISPLVFEKIPHSVCAQHYQQQLTSPQPGSPAEWIEDLFLQLLYQAIEEKLDNSQFDGDAWQ